MHWTGNKDSTAVSAYCAIRGLDGQQTHAAHACCQPTQHWHGRLPQRHCGAPPGGGGTSTAAMHGRPVIHSHGLAITHQERARMVTVRTNTSGHDLGESGPWVPDRYRKAAATAGATLRKPCESDCGHRAACGTDVQQRCSCTAPEVCLLSALGHSGCRSLLVYKRATLTHGSHACVRDKWMRRNSPPRQRPSGMCVAAAPDLELCGQGACGRRWPKRADVVSLAGPNTRRCHCIVAKHTLRGGRRCRAHTAGAWAVHTAPSSCLAPWSACYSCVGPGCGRRDRGTTEPDSSVQT